MPRPPRFTDDDVLDAALCAVAAHGPGATIAQVAAELQGPVGSIYHRFGSREELLARLWLRCIRRFHVGLLELADAPDPGEALVAAARYLVRYCAQHPDEALGMRLHRQDRLIADDRLAVEIRAEARTLNDAVDAVLAGLVRRRFGRDEPADLRRAVLATRVTPYGVVRPWLGGSLDPELEDAAAVAAEAILALGDRVAGMPGGQGPAPAT